MSELFLTLVAEYGAIVVGLSAFLSCLLIPIPTALVMLAGGAFAAAGDLTLSSVLVTAWLAAIAGDQAGYRVGRSFGPTIKARFTRRPRAAKAFAKAETMVQTHGGLGVFFSTWALAPLGPYANIAAGAVGLNAWRFALWDAAGEAIWVGAYVMLGYIFASQLTEVSSLMSNIVGFLLALVAAGFVGWLLTKRLKAHTLA